MNFLAHAYLSFGQPGLLVGNMISDFVKGKQQYDYPPGIREGIVLHRQIDQFTDEHPVTREAKAFFRPVYRLYSGAFIDVVYDHFLAADPNEFTDESLAGFAQQTYTTLQEHYAYLPMEFAGMLPYMRTHNWLYNYRTIEGISKSMAGLVRRSAYLNDSAPGVVILQNNYEALRSLYQVFWADVKAFVLEQQGLLPAS